MSLTAQDPAIQDTIRLICTMNPSLNTFRNRLCLNVMYPVLSADTSDDFETGDRELEKLCVTHPKIGRTLKELRNIYVFDDYPDYEPVYSDYLACRFADITDDAGEKRAEEELLKLQKKHPLIACVARIAHIAYALDWC